LPLLGKQAKACKALSCKSKTTTQTDQRRHKEWKRPGQDKKMLACKAHPSSKEISHQKACWQRQQQLAETAAALNKNIHKAPQNSHTASREQAEAEVTKIWLACSSTSKLEISLQESKLEETAAAGPRQIRQKKRMRKDSKRSTRPQDVSMQSTSKLQGHFTSGSMLEEMAAAL
jgi:hypothetical protein